MVHLCWGGGGGGYVGRPSKIIWGGSPPSSYPYVCMVFTFWHMYFKNCESETNLTIENFIYVQLDLNIAKSKFSSNLWCLNVNFLVPENLLWDTSSLKYSWKKKESMSKFNLSYDVAVIQWITSCHKNHMTTHVITLWRVCVMSLTTSMSTMHFDIELMFILKARKSPLRVIWSTESYTRGHFMWNLWNSPKARFINFIWNDHTYKNLYIWYKRVL